MGGAIQKCSVEVVSYFDCTPQMLRHRIQRRDAHFVDVQVVVAEARLHPQRLAAYGYS